MESVPLNRLAWHEPQQSKEHHGQFAKRNSPNAIPIIDLTAGLSESQSLNSMQHTLLSDHESESKDSNGYMSELKRSRVSITWLVFGDILAIVVWLVALSYTSLLWYANGKLLSDISFDAHLLIDSTQLVSTLFTIMFAATTGRSLRNLVLWLLESGNTIANLDRILGSTTVGGTIITCATTGKPNSMATFMVVSTLLLLWSLSPLGSQAVLRIATITNSTTHSQIDRGYLNLSRWEALPGAGSDGDLFVIAPNVLMNSVLASPFETKLQAEDVWGNPRIPRLEALSGQADEDGWIAVPAIGHLDYSSLIGIPLGKLDKSTNVTSQSTIPTWYWNLECDPWEFYDIYKNNSNWRNWSPFFNFNYSSSLYAMSPPLQVWTVYDDIFNRTGKFCNYDFAAENYSREIHYCDGLPARDIGFNVGYNIKSKCRISTSHVESRIACNGARCRVQSIRRSRDPNLPPNNWTIFDSFVTSSLYFTPLHRFLLNIVDAFASRNSGGGGSNAVLGYMAIPRNPFSIFNRGNADFTEASKNMTDETTTLTLAQVLNTYWMSNLGAELISGDWGQNFEFFTNATGAMGPTDASTLLDKKTTDLYTPAEMFICNTTWTACFTVAVIVALVMSAIGLVLNLLCQGPRLTFNLSTLARDSRYISTPPGGSYLDDDDGDKYRSVARKVVRLGDVKPNQPVGHIAVGSVSGSLRTERLRKRRFYD